MKLRELELLTRALPEHLPDEISKDLKYEFRHSLENEFRSRLASLKVFSESGTPLVNYVLVNDVVRVCKIELIGTNWVARNKRENAQIAHFLEHSRVYKDPTIKRGNE